MGDEQEAAEVYNAQFVEAEKKRAEKRRRVLARYASMRQAQKDAPPRNHRVPMRCDYCRTNGVETCDRCVRCIACCGCEAYDAATNAD